MAALTTIGKLACMGDEIIVNDDSYGGTYRLMSKVCSRQGIKVTYVNLSGKEGPSILQAVINSQTRIGEIVMNDDDYDDDEGSDDDDNHDDNNNDDDDNHDDDNDDDDNHDDDNDDDDNHDDDNDDDDNHDDDDDDDDIPSDDRVSD